MPPRTLVAGVPGKLVRTLTEQELAWKIEGTQSYQELARRSAATMTRDGAARGARGEPARIDVGELLPLSVLKARPR